MLKIECKPVETYKVVVFGLGDIGIGTTELVLNRSNLDMIGAVDIDENKAGRPLGDLLGNTKNTDIKISQTLSEVISASGKPDVVLQTTGSYINQIYPQLQELTSAGCNVISSAEELLYPYLRNPDLADKIDDMARTNNVTVLGTGVNPGFVMDALAMVLSGVCQKIDRVEAERVVDVSTRRPALQRKVGAGLTVDDFNEKLATGKFGHVGLLESLALVAVGMGWDLDELDEVIMPVVAEKDMDNLDIKKGHVTGIRQIGIGKKDGNELIKLILQISAGAEEPHDAVKIFGIPDMDVVINNGTAGGLATASSLVNAIPQVVEAEPGLALMGKEVFPRFAPDYKIKLIL
ncbi:dihydrodipicolinate reductase [Candidatus Poribacteria bacterium]|nr:dihydrodipicolinate reductase [Candidatus Poribacteria bacterium]